MTRKHFLELAKTLHREKPEPHWDPNKMTQWSKDVKAVAAFCANMNPRFDRNKFLVACGLEEC